MTVSALTVPRPRRARVGTALAAAVALSLVAAACGQTGSGAKGVPIPTTSTPTGTGTAAAATTKGYRSAITDGVVDDPRFDPLQGQVETRLKAAKLDGAALLVLQRGRLVEQEGFGSYGTDERVPIASASKWLTGATIMSVVDDDLLDLDAPISRYLPATKGAAAQITTRQLVSFTSGLPNDERIPCFNDRTVSLAVCNAQILAMPLVARPGTQFRYSGTHLHVAAGVVEAVTGQPFEQVFQERVAGPLGMTSTTFLRPGEKAAGSHPQPAGGARSTLGDYGRFLEMLVHDGGAPDGSRVLGQASVVEMSKDQTGGAPVVQATEERRAAGTRYGVAHWLDVIGPDGRATLESSPGKFGFLPWIDRTNGVAGVYLVVDRREGAAKTPRTSGEFVRTGVAHALGVVLPH